MPYPTAPTFEHLPPNPLGIGASTPRLSWSYAGPSIQDWKQTSYQIELQSRAGKDVYTTHSSENALVPWPAAPLQSRERALVRLRVTGTDCARKFAETPSAVGTADEDVSQEDAPWSAWSSVEAGILTHDEWKGCSLIEPQGADEMLDQMRRPVVFSRDFDVRGKLEHARIYVTAHGVYEARLNGAVVGDQVLAPGWTSYGHRLVYQVFDVGELVTGSEGRGRVEVTVAEGWFCGRIGMSGGRRDIYGDSLGLMAMLELVYDEPGLEPDRISTDESWTWSYGSILGSGIYSGERTDLRLNPTSAAGVRCLPVPKTISSLDGPPVRRTEELAVAKILTSPSGKKILDFGQNLVGRVRLSVHGSSGTTITLQHAEVLEHEELSLRPLRMCDAKDELTLARSERIVWEPQFTFHGFRYVQVDGWPGELRAEDFTGVVLHTDMKRTGHFECSNPLLNKLHSNVVWSMRGNFLSIPTDCPQRDERLGWTGDINLFANTAHTLYDTAGMLNSWLKDLALEQADAKGIVPLVIPNVIPGYEKDAHGLWGDVAVMLPWSMYQAYGDASILQQQYPSMQAWLAAIPRQSNGLWNYTAEWKLGDWLEPDAPPEDPGNAKTDPNLVNDAFLVHITSLMAEVSEILGKKDAQTKYSEAASQLHKAFAYEYITPSGRLSSDTQTAYVLAFHFRLLNSAEQKKRAAGRLDELVRRNTRFSIGTGFAGTAFFGHALSEAGLSDVFYRMLLHQKCPSWLYPVSMGATSIWERWDSMLHDGSVNPGEMTSFNHYSFGSVADWMYKRILGIRAAEPGWRVVAIEPDPGGDISWARGSYETASGICRVVWRTHTQGEANATFELTVNMPPNMTARIRLPGSDKIEVRGSGEHTWRVPYSPRPWPPRALFPPMLEPDDQLPPMSHLPFPG